MGTTLEGIQVIQSCWKYMICVENGDSTHSFFIPGGIFFTQDLLRILPNPIFLFFLLSYFVRDDSGIEMIGRALLGSGADWSMASIGPAADPVPDVPVTYEGYIDTGEKPVKVSNGNPKWMKLTVP